MNTPDPSTRRLPAGIALLVSLVLATAGLFLPISKSIWATDYYNHWGFSAADQLFVIDDLYSSDEMARNGQELDRIAQMSTISDRQKKLAHAYKQLIPLGTPFACTFVKSVSRTDFDRDFQIFRSIVFFSFSLGVMLLLIALGIGWAPTILITLLCLSFPPFWFDASLGNTNSVALLLAGAGVFFYDRLASNWRYALCAFLLTIAAMLKPMFGLLPACILLLWIFQNKGRAVAIGTASVAGASSLVWLISRSVLSSGPKWSQYLEAVTEFYGTVAAHNFLGRWTGHAPTFWATTGICLLVVASVFVAAVTLRRVVNHSTLQRIATNDTRDAVAAISLGLSVYLSLGPVVEYAQFVGLLPGLLFLWKPLPFFSSRRRTFLRYGFMAILTALVYVDFSNFLRIPQYQIPQLGYLSAAALAICSAAHFWKPL